MLNVIAPQHIHTIDSRSFTSLVRDTLRTWSVARRAGIDTVVNLETFVRYSSLLSYLTGAARRVGFHRFTQEGLYTGDFLTHKVMYNPHIHTGHVFLDLVHALVAPPGGIPIVKRPRAGDDLVDPRAHDRRGHRGGHLAQARDAGPGIGPSKKLVVLNPNASKRFPDAHACRSTPTRTWHATSSRIPTSTCWSPASPTRSRTPSTSARASTRRAWWISPARRR